jgi:FMN reductase [NAD(P)H]
MKDNKMPSHHGVKEEPKGSYPNETMKLLLERGSCRNFVNKKIPPQVMDMVLRAGVHAATGGNLQPYSIIKIERAATNRKLAKMCHQPFIGQAPVNLLFCLDWRRLQRWAKLEDAPFNANNSFRHFWISFQDTIICAQNICTAADALGLGSVYIGTVMEFFPSLKRMFRLPKGVFPVVLLTVGYPKARPKPRKKLGTKVVVHNERYADLKDSELEKAFYAKYPDVRIELSAERLKRFKDVCVNVGGEKFAQRCVARAQKQGYISPVQRYFGLHYVADYMSQGNPKFMKQFEAFGFGWFREAKLKRAK